MEDDNNLPLTKGEIRILLRFAPDRKAPQVAWISFLSVHTVCNHRKNILSKLKKHTIHGALIEALKRGIIRLRDIK